MSLYTLLWRNILHRKTLSLLTVFSVTITVALVVFLLMCSQGVEQGAEKGYGPFEVTIGVKGSASQMALNTYYHIGAPTGNVPYSLVQKVQQNSQVEAAYAMTTGDNYNGFPIIGMEPGYFLTRYGDKQLADGKLYGNLGETVVGAYVAKTLGLHVGDTFQGAHGLVQGAGEENHDEGEEHDEHHLFSYKIVGILPPLYTSDDRAVFTTLDYAWAVHHNQTGDHKEVTAILVKPRSLLGAQTIKNEYSQIDNVQAIYTSKAVADVVNIVDKGTQMLEIVTIICIVLASVSILLSLIAAVNERKKDVGLLRLIGKPKQFVWFALIGEGFLLTFIGLLAGLVIGHVGGYVSRDAVFAFSGLQLNAGGILPGEWMLVAGTLLIGLLASAGPAIKAYRVDPLQLFRA
ncbi:FtsX-like permease family protein [Brevibacillus fluminis]|uniref:Putative hemin transport system permease protein HrtB n=1 Tax=Brevibacillus fluminis TaxID=511487 RepID=A0A3M8D5L7_9BACL|nr:FtsX-like permease family protein [Brevibacillus fluminis]RNB83374.1 FtsX-like permease family protein [Brevibacillus fluminis]